MPIELGLDSLAETVLFESKGAVIRRSVLPGGIRVLTERDPNMRSASIGFWLPVGSRDESPEHAGSTHFLEHLLFKGTKIRSALEIAEAFDEVGGESNAVTAKEHTCYYAKVRSTDVPMAVMTLADMITSSVLAEDAFYTEREVILEELAMAEDDPGDIGHDLFTAEVLGAENALGRPVGGTPATIMNATVESVRAHYLTHYVPQNLVVTAVGDLEHEDFCRLVLNSLEQGGWDLSSPAAKALLPLPRRAQSGFKYPELSAGATGIKGLSAIGATKRVVREIEQTHLFLGGPGICAPDERRHALSLMMSILGGGMSSRLFQEIREKRGLVYSVYGFSSGYRDAGLFGLYAACRAQHADKVAGLMLTEIAKLAESGVSPQELRRTKGQMAGSMALGLEEAQARMGRLASAELMHGKFRSFDEALQGFEQVTQIDIQQLAQLLAENLSVRLDVGINPAAQKL